MADSAVAITAGTGTNVDAYQVTGGDYQQIVREARGTAYTASYWTVTTTGKVNLIVADASRVALLMTSSANGRVYLRFGSILPTSTDFDWWLEPGDRWEVPIYWSTLSMSVRGASAGGQINWHLATAA